MLTLHYWQAPSLPGPYLSPGFKDRDAGAVTLEPLAKYDPDGNIEPAWPPSSSSTSGALRLATGRTIPAPSAQSPLARG